METTPATSNGTSTIADHDRNLVKFLQQINAIDTSDGVGSPNVRELVDVFALFLLRHNLSAATVQAAFYNESLALGELFNQRQNPSLLSPTNFSLLGTGVTAPSELNSQNIRTLFAMPMPARTIIQAAYMLLIAVALTGNCTVIVVYSIAQRWRDDISIFHVQLSLADILMATFCIPFTMQQVSP